MMDAHTSLHRLIVFKVSNPHDARLIARRGDSSLLSGLCVNEIECSSYITVCAIPDTEKEFEAPSPRFASSTSDGKSGKVYQVLLDYFLKHQKDGKLVLVGTTTKEAKGKVVLFRNSSGDMLIRTTNEDETEEGVKVCFPLKGVGSPEEVATLSFLRELISAIQKLNKKDPSFSFLDRYVEWSRRS